MKKWWCCAIIALSGIPGICLAQSASSTSAPLITLDEAIATALAENRQVQESALDVAKAMEEIAVVRTSRFPQLSANVLSGIALKPIDFTIPRGTLGVYPGLGPLPATDAIISTPRQFAGVFQGSIAQPVSQLYKIGLAVRESQVAEQLARENLQQQRQDTVRQVRQAYAQLAQTLSEIESAERALEYLTQLSTLTDRRLAEQTVLRSDSLAVKAKVSQQRYQLLTLRDTFDSQRDAFNRLLGRDLGREFSVELQPAPSSEEVDLGAAQSRAVDRRPEVRRAHLQITKADLDVRRARAEYVPDLNIQLSYLSFLNVNFLPGSIANFGVTLQWQPFDWGQKHHRVAELRIAAQQAQVTAADVEAQIRVDVRDAYRRLLEARVLLDVQALAQETDREKLRVLMNRYEQSAALLPDLLQAQSSLAQTDAQYQQAVAGFWTAKANFERAVGENH